jgi:nitrogen fixation protein FixH
VIGYNVYFGTASRVYSQVRNAGPATTITISNLVEGTTYYFAATAYDSWGLESDYSAETVYTVPVPVLNYPPTLTALSPMTIAENSATQNVPLAGISSGSAAEQQTLVVTAASSNPSLIPNPVVSYSSPNSTGSLAFTPSPNLYGTSTISVTVNDGGVPTNTVTRTFLVTVFSVNQRPTLSPITDVAAPEDSAPFTVSLTGISSGAPNETQTLSVTATSSSTALIPAPTVAYTSPSSNATLTLRPVATKYGTATITVNVNDAGTSNNIVSQTFLVNVTPVNDQPTINTLTNITMSVGGITSKTVALSGIGTGATNETQTLTVTATSSDPAVVPSPTVTYSSPSATGSLLLVPAGQIGSSLITVTVSDGGSENPTKSVSFTVTINDPPTISDIAHRAIALGSNMPPTAFIIGDTETSASSLTVTATSSNPTLVPNSNIVLAGSGANRTIAINPVANRTGTSTITVTVSDGTTTTADTFQLAVQQRPTAPGNLHMVIEGQGSITGLSASSALVVGQTYTVTAVPAPEQEFAGWTGSVVSSAPTVSFVASTNTELKAKFIPSPYLPTKGIYSGLFYESDQVRHEGSGYFSFQSSSKGKYTGYLQMGSKKYSFSGKFDLQCQATNMIKRLGKSPLLLNLAMATNGSETVAGTVADTNWIASLSGDKATFHSRTNPAPWVGKYTAILPGQDADPLLPFGHSYGTLKIASSGTAILAGKLADGTPYTKTVRMSKNGALPLYLSLYYGAGSILSWTGMEDRDTDDLHGDAQWTKPAITTALAYPAGFSFMSTIIGAKYATPTNGAPVVTLADNTVTFSIEGREFLNPIEVGRTGAIKNLGTNKMTLNVVPGSGTFRGTVVDADTGKSLAFAGSILQKQMAGYGFIKTGTNVGRVTIH